MAFKRILVAYDGSNPSQLALRQGIELVQADAEASLHVVHVYQLPQYFLGDAFMTGSPKVNQELVEFSTKVENRAREEVVFLGGRAVVETVQGPLGPSIVDYAEKNHIDLVVIGSRGLSGLKEFVLGSVSHHVVQSAKCPVLVIKEKE
ncbi:universal stress protein [Paenibacillus arenosi]|uniref:Universal stress protein n=1 Tax=Paenibacillus arenosi TaxID=2774142 RepID=A0ABR9B1Z7_9BACL|nr:universal stress protein [Paenibacillus arenosi]MBD8500395.1 universal stress protein [Paenibacillus arenosi]